MPWTQDEMARRAAQSARGRPISVSAIGVAIIAPKVSPTHQVSQVSSAPVRGTMPAAVSTGVATLGATTQASAPPRPNSIATSRGSSRARGWRA